MGAKYKGHLYNVPSHKLLKSRTTLTASLFAWFLQSGPRYPKFSTCGELPPRNCSIAPHLLYIHIWPYIHVEVALGQNCQMYNKLAAQGGSLPYNSDSNERVNVLNSDLWPVGGRLPAESTLFN